MLKTTTPCSAQLNGGDSTPGEEGPAGDEELRLHVVGGLRARTEGPLGPTVETSGDEMVAPEERGGNGPTEE